MSLVSITTTMAAPLLCITLDDFTLQLVEYGGDLEAFAKHAKRSTIQADDVKLLVRRNKGLVS